MFRASLPPKPTKTPYKSVCYFRSNPPYCDTLIFFVDEINRLKNSEYDIRYREIALPMHAYKLNSQMACTSILTGIPASVPTLPPHDILDAQAKIKIIQKKIQVLEKALEDCTEFNFETVKTNALANIAAIEKPPSVIASGAIPSSSYKPYSR